MRSSTPSTALTASGTLTCPRRRRRSGPRSRARGQQGTKLPRLEGAGAQLVLSLRENDDLDDVPIARIHDDHFLVVDEVLIAPPTGMDFDEHRRQRREMAPGRDRDADAHVEVDMAHARRVAALDHL